MKRTKSFKFVLSIAIHLVCVALPLVAGATPTTVTIEYTAPFGDYNGRTYNFAEGTMSGTEMRTDGTTDEYIVPFFMIHPVAGTAPTGVVMIEPANSSFWRNYQEVVCGRGVPFCDPTMEGEQGHRLTRMIVLRALINSQDDMFLQGHTYMAFQPDFNITDSFGPTPPAGERRRLSYGTIPHSTNYHEIVRDTTRFWRNPSAYWDAGATGEPMPAAATTVIGYGSSGPGMYFRQFLRDGLNRVGDGTLYFDGFLILISGRLCHTRSDVDPYQALVPCNGPPAFMGTMDQPVIAVNTETDVVLFRGDLVRPTDLMDPMYRVYELPAVSHIPLVVNNLSILGAVRQNIADYRPVMRASLRHLIAWVQDPTGYNPPPSIFMDGTEVANPPGVMPPTRFVQTYDREFFPTGGLRLPHLPSTIGGMPAGAPLGQYGGLDWQFEAGPMMMPPRNSWPLFGGFFNPWTESQINFRYPTKDVYVTRITLVADDLATRGYITTEDRDRIIAQASLEPPVVENPGSGSDGGAGGADGGPGVTGDESSGCSCRVGRTGGAPASAFGLSVLVAGWWLVRRRRLRRALLPCALLAAGLVLSACSEDTVMTPPDGPPGQMCTGHGCPGTPVTLPEGGEVRLELVYLGDGPSELRTHAWFASAQDPELRPYTSPPLTWRSFGEGFCADMSEQVFWPSGNPVSRAYVDVGDSVTMTSGSNTVQLARYMNEQDTAFNDFHDIIYLNDLANPASAPAAAEFTVEVSGSGDYPARTFTVPMILPDDYQITFPNMSDFVTIPRDRDFPITWTNPKDEDYYYAFVVFGDVYDSFYRCFGPNIGAWNIPKEVIQAIPPGGFIQHGVMYHRSEEVNGRRVDLIGVNCYQATYATVTSP